MVRAATSGKKRTSQSVSTASAAGVDPPVPGPLARSAVYKRVPVAVRTRLDEAILLRPADCPTLEAMAEKFDLAARYGVSLSALRTYARKLEAFIRPVVSAQLMSGVLGCLPQAYRERLVAGSQVLLLSRVVQALTAEHEHETGLSVADLAKLASVLSALGPSGVTARGKAGRGRSGKSDPAQTLPSPESPAKLAETVSLLYGIAWPPTDKAELK